MQELSSALDHAIEMMTPVTTRAEVRNHEPRPRSENNRHLWWVLMERDAGKCWMCRWDDGRMVIDHLRPRSNFEPHEMWLADRSDNLRIACWDCNKEKSNRPLPFHPPLPVVWYCVEDFDPDEYDLSGYNERPLKAFCAHCRTAVMVPADWDIAGLE